MNSTEFLKKTAPDWVVINPLIVDKIQLIAKSILPSGAPSNQYFLQIYEAQGKLNVREFSDSKVLPLCCIERHINIDSTFCVFYGSIDLITSHDAAVRWWNGLRQFLSDQAYATKHRKWPSHRSMSHGDAAEVQLQMETLAIQNDWIKEILSGMFRNEGWLGGLMKRANSNSRQIFYQRGPCPRGCLYRHAPNLQKDCYKKGCSKDCEKKHAQVLLTDCPNRNIVNDLIILEYERRKREYNYVQQIANKGIKCCGTMDDCPLL